MERERERVCVCVCVCERERECVCVCVWMQEGARHSDAIRVGPVWLQQHGCKFVTDVNLRQKEADMREQNGGKSNLYFNPWPRLDEGEYICDKYAMCEVAI